MIAKIKSQNQSNGYIVRRGWKNSAECETEQWRHLQYAYDRMMRPEVDTCDLMMALECLNHSGINYKYQPIPWGTIHAEYPEPAPRARKPIIHPGPPEDWLDTDPEWENEVWRELIAGTHGVSPAIPTTEPAIEPIPAAIKVSAAPEPVPEQATRPVRRIQRLPFYDRRTA